MGKRVANLVFQQNQKDISVVYDFVVEYASKVENGKDYCHELLFFNVFNKIFYVLKITK